MAGSHAARPTARSIRSLSSTPLCDGQCENVRRRRTSPSSHISIQPRPYILACVDQDVVARVKVCLEDRLDSRLAVGEDMDDIEP